MRTITMALAFLTCAALTSAGQDDKSKYLDRSVYVPVTFRTCEHIEHPMLYASNAEGEQLDALAVLPGERKFMFTYYPTLERIEPAMVIVMIVGDVSGKEIHHYITITSDTIHLSQERRIELKDISTRFRYRQDIRHKNTTVTVQCEGHETPKEAIVATRNN